MQARIKKLSENLNESEVKEFIIGRSKSPQEIDDDQINRLSGKFQELENKIGISFPEEEKFL